MLNSSLHQELATYVNLSPKSKEMFDAAQKYLPDGVTRGTGWDPYPLFWEKGKGCNIWDLDGVNRLDFFGNNSALPLGHSHPKVTKALDNQIRSGTSFNAPHPSHVTLAKIICDRIKTIEMVRFTNSGTEATMNCIHAARAFSGRHKIAKVDGAYHGLYDAVAFDGITNQVLSSPKPNLPGIPPALTDETIVIPFNDSTTAKEILERHKAELAAVIVEPLMGGAGFIQADKEYLSTLRQVTTENDIVLIFDEVCGLRAGPGAGQGLFNVYPDMTALGKSVGGGLPLGAFGGKREIMDLYKSSEVRRHVGHSGSFNGNPLSMTSGAVTFEQLTPETYDRLDELTEYLRLGISSICGEFGIPVQVTGLGSLFAIHFNDKPVKNARDASTDDQHLRQQVFLGLMNRGIWSSPSLLGALSTSISMSEIESYLEALRSIFGNMR